MKRTLPFVAAAVAVATALITPHLFGLESEPRPIPRPELPAIAILGMLEPEGLSDYERMLWERIYVDINPQTVEITIKLTPKGEEAFSRVQNSKTGKWELAWEPDSGTLSNAVGLKARQAKLGFDAIACQEALVNLYGPQANPSNPEVTPLPSILALDEDTWKVVEEGKAFVFKIPGLSCLRPRQLPTNQLKYTHGRR